MTYLPPIDEKVTEFSIINRYLSYMQKLAKEANMPFVNVSLDVGAAINAYKLTWNYPDEIPKCDNTPWRFSFHQRKLWRDWQDCH